MAEDPENLFQSAVSSEDRLDILFRLLESGDVKSLGELQSKLESPTEKALIKGASLLRSFDETLYTTALQFFSPPDYPAMSFADFAQSPNLEQIPRTNQTFRVKDRVRQDCLKEWSRELSTADKSTLTNNPLLQKLLSHYQNQDDLDRLSILILTNPAEAQAKFLQLFAKADKNFDLAGGNDIVKTLEDRSVLLTPELLEVCQQKRQYLTARNLFAPDYSQTVFYYARKSVVKAFRNLLKDKETPKWIFQLYAKGGMGKTMFVRWLLSRHCVPRAIPIARLDFDLVHRQTARRYPWLLLLSIAEQINKQILDRPFDRYLRSYFDFVSLLNRPEETSTTSSRNAKEKQLKSIEPHLRDTIGFKFIDALKESSFRGTFVIVLDTLEEMALHRKQALASVLNQLKAIHEGYDRTRLLLAGRYNLEECLREFKGQIRKETVTHELQPFSRGEARAYLTTNRDLNNRTIVSAIIAKCETSKGEEAGSGVTRRGSNPFKLSLFADLYEQREVTTKEDIRSYPSTDIEYLIERVIRRIKEPTVQWLLRYAVIPRQFTYEFFEQVLAFHLEQELIKLRKLDEVNSKFPRGAEAFNDQENWKRLRSRRSRTLNLRAIWNDLRKYASGYSFITFESRDDSAPRLQPDVVVPMRRLLEEQRIFRPLHTSAERYFIEKAKLETDPKHWARHIREAIYHRFQRQGSKAGAEWRKQLGRVQCRRYPDVRKTIAEEILRRDYVDEDSGEPLRKLNGQFMVAPEDLGEALSTLIEAEVASMSNQTPAEQSTSWEDLGDRLDQLKKLREKHGRRMGESQTLFKPANLRRLALLMMESQIDFKGAIRLLRQAIRTTATEQMRLALTLQLGDALAVLNDPESLVHYKQALRLSRSVKFSQVDSSDVYLKIGQTHYEARNYVAAERAYHAALRTATDSGDADAARNTLRSLADLNLELGLYSKASDQLAEGLRIARNVHQKPTLLDVVLSSHVHARGFQQPLQALRGLTPYLRIAKTVRERAAVSETHGVLLGKLMKFDDALTQLETAKELWTEAPDRLRTDRARRRRIELQLFDIGNFHEADYLLTTWEDIGSKIDPDLTCQLRLLRVLWTHRNGDARKARRQWLKVMKDDRLGKYPAALVRALATGLALGFGASSTVKAFIRGLRRIKPAAARLPLLTAFQYAVSNCQASPSERLAIKELVDIKSHGQDIIPHALTSADVLFWCGASRRVKKHLDQAAKAARRRKNWFAYRSILLARDRLKTEPADGDLLSASGFFKDFAEFPNLCAAAFVEQAERDLNRKDFAACKDALMQAREGLTTETTTQLEAHFHYLSGELRKAEGKSGLAVKEFRAAVSRYEKLGNQPMVEALRKLLPTIDHPSGRDTEVIMVRMKSTPKALVIDCYRDEALESSTNVYATQIRPLPGLVRADVIDRSAIYHFSKLLIAKTRDVERDLGKILFKENFGGRPKAVGTKQLPDFSLDSLTPSLAKIPWEFARVKERPIRDLCRCFYRSTSQTVRNAQGPRWLQFALQQLATPDLVADGIMGPDTLMALDKLRKKFKIPASLSGAELNAHIGDLLVGRKAKRTTRVLVICASSDYQLAWYRRERGPSVDWLYENNYFRVETLWASQLSSLKGTVRKFQPDVIHIQSSFKEMPSTGQIYLDFGDEALIDRETSYSMDIASFPQPSPSYLNDALAVSDRAKLRPLVILDAVCPTGITETVHQLTYRNVFAAELFQVGYTTGVIAMGLARRADLVVDQAQSLINGMSNTQTLGGIVNSLRLLSSSRELAEQIPTAGVALFANEPGLTVLAPE